MSQRKKVLSRHDAVRRHMYEKLRTDQLLAREFQKLGARTLRLIKKVGVSEDAVSRSEQGLTSKPISIMLEADNTDYELSFTAS